MASAPGVAEKFSVTFDAASSAASRNSLAKVSKKRTCAALVRPAAAFEAPAPKSSVRDASSAAGATSAVYGRFVAAFTSDTPSASTKAMASVPATCAVKTTSNVPRIETSAYVSL